MNNIEKAKKIINETKTALVKYVISENISKGEKLSFIKFIKESSNYNILHFAAKGIFPKTKNVPIKSLLEQAVIIQNKSILRETFDYDNVMSDMKNHILNLEFDIDEFYRENTYGVHMTLRAIAQIALLTYIYKKGKSMQAAKQFRNEPAKAAAIMKAGIKNARLAKINTLKQKSTLCDKTKDPQKCKKAVLDIIKKEQAKK
jgi:hypothetical protein